jgi:integrase
VHTPDLLDGSGGAELVVHGNGGKPRVVPLCVSVAELIERAPDGWLFPNCTGGHLTAGQVDDPVVRVLPDGWTMHTWRHRFSSRATAAPETYALCRCHWDIQALLLPKDTVP